MGYQAPRNVGDRHPLIPEAKRKLAGYTYGRALGADRSDVYTPEFGAALRTFGSNVHTQVLKGQRQAPDVNVLGVFDWAIQKQLGIAPAPAVPPAVPKNRAVGYVWRGTGGVVGDDLVYQVLRGCEDLVELVDPPWAATMGGIPVGTAGGIGDPSMWSAVQATVAWTQTDFIARHAVNPKIRIVLGGYSAGAIACAIFKAWLMEHFPENYVCSFSLGDPTRPEGGGFYGRTPAWGSGISTTHYGDPKDPRHCWCAHEEDIYTQKPRGVVGDIMDDVYEEVTRFAFRDITLVASRMVAAIPAVAGKAGISLPGAFAALASGPFGIASFTVPLLLSSIGGFVPNADPDTLTGTAAAAKAATLGLKFLFAGTGPHIRYHLDEAWPGGPTFVDLCRMHVRDWCSRPAAAA